MKQAIIEITADFLVELFKDGAISTFKVLQGIPSGSTLMEVSTYEDIVRLHLIVPDHANTGQAGQLNLVIQSAGIEALKAELEVANIARAEQYEAIKALRRELELRPLWSQTPQAAPQANMAHERCLDL